MVGMGHFTSQLGESESCAFKDTDTDLACAFAEVCRNHRTHLSYLNYTKYTVTVGFEHLKRPVKDLNFTVSTPADHSVPMAHLCSSHSLWNDRNKSQL